MKNQTLSQFSRGDGGGPNLPIDDVIYAHTPIGCGSASSICQADTVGCLRIGSWKMILIKIHLTELLLTSRIYILIGANRPNFLFNFI